MIKKEEQVVSVPYDKNCFFWGVMYKPSSRAKPHVVSLHPKGNDARRIALHNNRQWEKEGWGAKWSVKRFKFYFKGEEIDAYEHTREVKKKKP